MYRRIKYEPIDDGEYELYRYNIPPRYDGSSFRKRSYNAAEGVIELTPSNPTPAKETKAELDFSEGVPEEEKAAAAAPATENGAAEEKGILAALSEKLDREELFIIALALAIADGDGKGDILLLLMLLLYQGDSGKSASR